MKRFIKILFLISIVITLISCSSNNREKIFTSDLANFSWDAALNKISKVIGVEAQNLILQEFLVSWEDEKTENIYIIIIDKSNHNGYSISYQRESSDYTIIKNHCQIKNVNDSNVVQFKDVIDILNTPNIISILKIGNIKRLNTKKCA